MSALLCELLKVTEPIWPWFSSLEKKEFLLWLSGLRTQSSACENSGSIPGLALWAMELVLPTAEVQVIEAARIWWCVDVV